MKDREQPEPTLLPDRDTERPADMESASPILDADVFIQIRDVIRQHYFWKWESDNEETQTVITDLAMVVAQESDFRLVGDIEVVEHVFEMTLWLQDHHVFRLADVDVLLVVALDLDFGQGTFITRKLVRAGIEYNVITFEQGRVKQFHIDIIGPRIQQIRDISRLVVSSSSSFSA